MKIDRSFVAGLPGHLESEEVIKAIVSIAESLDFYVIAEGVETAEQVEKLEALRCRYAQGRVVASPMTAADLEATGRPLSAPAASPERRLTGAPGPAPARVRNRP